MVAQPVARRCLGTLLAHAWQQSTQNLREWTASLGDLGRRISRSGRKTITMDMDENGRYELTKPNRAFNTNQVQTILAAWGEGERVGAGAPRVARAEEGARVEARVVTVVRLTANAGRDAKCRA